MCHKSWKLSPKNEHQIAAPAAYLRTIPQFFFYEDRNFSSLPLDKIIEKEIEKGNVVGNGMSYCESAINFNDRDQYNQLCSILAFLLKLLYNFPLNKKWG